MASFVMAIPSTKQSHVPITAGRNFPLGWISISVVHLSIGRRSFSIVNGPCGSALSWTNSRGFGKTLSHSVSCISQTAKAGPSQRKLQVMAFTPEQSKLVKDSWKLVQKDDAGKWALVFFLKVFEIAPTVKRMFSFLKDSNVPLEKNPKLKGHALQVFMLTGQAATQLGEKGGVDALIPTLVKLGDSHVTYGVLDEHFDVVRFALLATLQEALPEQFTPEVKEAWATAYDEIVSKIKEEMVLVRAQEAKASPGMAS
ncbi:unnamed protein product [Calypogeia fissa]